MVLDRTTPEALEVLRAAARGAGSTVDDLAGEIVAGRLDPADLRVPEDPHGAA